MSGSNYGGPNFVITQRPDTSIERSNPQLWSALLPIYNGFNIMIDNLISFCGIASRPPDRLLVSNNDATALLANNVHRFYTQATETIAQGALVSLTVSVGVLVVRNANATTGTKPCDGFCSQIGGIAAGAIGEIILNDGIISGLTGLVAGTRYYLGTTNGQLTATAPVAAGNLQQSVGIAIDANNFRFFTGPQIQH